MINTNDAKARCLMTCDYIARTIYGAPVDHPFNHMWAASLLATCGSEFGLPHFVEAARQCLRPVTQQIYRQNEKQYIIHNGNTQPLWNALYAVCMFKLGDTDAALAHCDSINFFETSRHHNGVLVNAYIRAFQHTSDIKYARLAKESSMMVIASERLSSFDALSLAMMVPYIVGEPIDEFERYVLRMIETCKVATKHMIGVVAPTVVQICLAHKLLRIWKDEPNEHFDDRMWAAFDHQVGLQAVPGCVFDVPPYACGSFVRSAKDTDSRLDYNISSGFMLLQFIKSEGFTCPQSIKNDLFF
jgi:hypothetical protein